MENRLLSVELTELLAEANSLLNLKAGFGRLPDSAVKTAGLKCIQQWFQNTGVSNKAKSRSIASIGFTYGPLSVKEEGAGGSKVNSRDPLNLADVPDDDDIPF